MCLLFETIKIENGQIRNLDYHNRRFNSSRRALFGNAGPDSPPDPTGLTGDPGINDKADPADVTVPVDYPDNGYHADLSSLIPVPGDLDPGIFRCRVLYGREIKKIEFHPHRTRIIRSLKLLSSDQINYSYKYADRSLLDSLFEQRAGCDEILIVKNGFITDTSISNIIFRLTDGSWVTPDTPLLNGTMRMYLLESGRITEASVRPKDLPAFTGAKMINCMMDLDTGSLIEMKHIVS